MKRYIFYIFVCFIFCFYCNTATAQSAPGLVGKRLTLSYDFNPYANLVSYYVSPSQEKSFFDRIISYKHIIGADYVLTRSLSVGADVGFSNHLLNNYRDTNISYEPYRHRLSTREYGLRLKYFSAYHAGSIAPIGPYLQFRLMGFWYKSEMSLIDKEDAEPDAPLSYVYDERGLIAGSFGFGHQNILFGSIIFNVGCEMALVLAPKHDENESVDDTIRSALLYANAFKMKFGIAVPIY